ncbi:MAG: glucose 1-dehydrogenase [Planctomycetota bacterium]|jgi:NAD(P)-dependent dehydrogenase (short-subunit alcohol dehydrogenase family)|nr:glucose 1-dehydrogenase [Planctomycetota bacterium]MDP7131488.1 glucose 1-dehydrogenase [Planctomycetota bacterium]MDP7248735.1 glucose 1-dehydrogenase [Planctomycetota bacterium]
MELGLNDKVAVITGAASGIGRATAQIFAAEGARVLAVDLNSRGGKETVASIQREGGTAQFLRADVSTSTGAKEISTLARREFGGVDVLHNNAAIIRSHSVTGTKEREWDKIIDVNLKSIYLCSRQCIPLMKKRGGGVIVNTASVHSFASIPEISSYAAAKGGVLALTRQMAQDYGKDNIRVNCICPGATDTPMLRAAVETEPDPEKTIKEWEASCPLNRLGQPEDMGNAVAFLASDKAGFITGQALVVDGGLLSGL